MKRKLLIIFILFLPMLVYADIQKKNYNIIIPEEYIKDTTKETQDFWQKKTKGDASSILVVTFDNLKALDIRNYTPSLIKSEEKIFVDSFKSQLESSGYSVEIKNINSEIKKINDYDSIVMDIESDYTIENNVHAIIYQKQYIFSSTNYIYYLTFTSSSKSYINSDEVKKVILSFKINDELIKKSSNNKNVLYIFIGTFVIGIIVILFIIRKK